LTEDDGAVSGDPLAKALAMLLASRLKCFKGGWMLVDELLVAPSLDIDCTAHDNERN